MKKQNLGIEEAIALIQADAQKDQNVLQEVGKIQARIEDLDSRKAAGTISDEDLEKELQEIWIQLDLLIDEDLRADHPEYDRLIKDLN